MTKNELFERLRGYMIAAGERSADRYVSYLKELDRKLPQVAVLLDSVARAGKPIPHAEEILLEIERVFQSPSNLLKSKKGDYLAAVRKLIAVLEKRPSASTAVKVEVEDGWITYESSVPDEARISGLIPFLEKEYDRICKFAQKMLGNVLQELPKVSVYLSDKRPEKTYWYSRAFLLEEMERQCGLCCGTELPRGAVSGVLEQHPPFTMPIGGQFYPGQQPYIVLYFKNLGKADFYAKIAETLAHEYLHWLHHYYVVRQCGEKPIKSERVKEALADFFGVRYAMERGDMAVAEARYREWKERKGADWPYSCALRFFDAPCKGTLSEYTSEEIRHAEGRFIQIFCQTDPKAAESSLGV